MAYSSYGKKVYASIKDLPQYTTIGNGDKIIIWNETRDGAAVVDYADLLIDLDHTTFKTTVEEIITLSSNLETFVHTVTEEITGLQETVSTIEDTINNEIKSRIKALEFIIAIILGSNSYWLSSAGLDVLKTRFLVDGISEGMGDDSVETEEGKNAIKWYNGLMTTIRGYVSRILPGVSNDDILLQSKFRYKYVDLNSNTNSSASTSSTEIKKVSTTSTETDGSSTTTTTTTITR